MGKNIFLTGATGLLGSYVATELLKRGHTLYLLARTRDGVKSSERVFEALRFWGMGNPDKFLEERLKVLEGDVEFKGLGLEEKDLKLFKGKEIEVLHCAACTSFSPAASELLESANVEGTKNILDFASGIKAKVFHFVSTAYVAGDFKGRFCEKDLDVGQGFNNIYEKTKYESEVIARKFLEKEKIPGNFFRPGIIMGDYASGRTTNFNALYIYFKVLYSVRKKLEERIRRKDSELEKLGIREENNYLVLPFRIAVNPDAKKNIVPVDFVGKAICVIAERECQGINTFHLTNPSPPAFSWLNSELHPGIGVKGITLVSKDDYESGKPNRFERIINDSIKIYGPYFEREPEFESSQTSGILASSGLSFPELDKEYYLRVIDYAVGVDFGEKKEPCKEPVYSIFFKSLEKRVGESIIPNLKTLNSRFSIKLSDLNKNVFLLIENGVLKKISQENGFQTDFKFVLTSKSLEEPNRNPESKPGLPGCFFRGRRNPRADCRLVCRTFGHSNSYTWNR